MLVYFTPQPTECQTELIDVITALYIHYTLRRAVKICNICGPRLERKSIMISILPGCLYYCIYIGVQWSTNELIILGVVIKQGGVDHVQDV